MLKFCGLLLMMFVSGSSFVFGQANIEALGLEDILTRANEQARTYSDVFRNLLAEETKTFETFDKKGSVKNRRVIESNFLVYQSLKDENLISEYRNVVRVDGKTVGDSEKRAQDFFEKVLRSTTVDRELKRIQDEGNRFDKNLDINGLTLHQTPVLIEHIRPYFDFKIIGEETLDGNEVYVIAYQQKSDSPYIIFNGNKESPKELSISYDVDISGKLENPNARLRGKLWIDRQSFQIRREQRELTIQPNGLNEPLVAAETNLEYQSENFNILTPKTISFIGYDVKSKDKGKEISVVKDIKATFEYTKFTKTDVEVESSKVK